MKEHLNQKIQVLISNNDLQEINNIILQKALNIGGRPEPLSTFIRKLIKNEISNYKNQSNREQKSYLKIDLKDITKK